MATSTNNSNHLRDTMQTITNQIATHERILCLLNDSTTPVDFLVKEIQQVNIGIGLDDVVFAIGLHDVDVTEIVPADGETLRLRDAFPDGNTQACALLEERINQAKEMRQAIVGDLEKVVFNEAQAGKSEVDSHFGLNQVIEGEQIEQATSQLQQLRVDGQEDDGVQDES